VINIGAGLKRLGKKVLLIDLDHQAHLTYSLGIKAHELERLADCKSKGRVKREEFTSSRCSPLASTSSRLMVSMSGKW